MTATIPTRNCSPRAWRTSRRRSSAACPPPGAIARTATSIRSGARTPVAGIIHSLTLLTILLVAAPLARHIPLAVLAAILLMVAWNMGEWAEIPDLLRLTIADISVWAVTFLLTVVADLTVAVEFGMILAALLFIRKVSRTTSVTRVGTRYVVPSSASMGPSCSAPPTNCRRSPHESIACRPS